MSWLTVEKAKEFHRRHPGLSFPVDMERLAEAEGCELVDWPLLEPYTEVKRDQWIGLARGLSRAERRHLIAHALAHHLMHSGNQVSLYERDKVIVSQQERQAEECAAHILMPEEELQRVGNMPVWELAEYFGVPEELARQRVSEFATDKELARRQAAVKTTSQVRVI